MMSGQPGDDEAAQRPDAQSSPVTTHHSASALTPAARVPPGPGQPADQGSLADQILASRPAQPGRAPGGGPVSDFGKFDWFTDYDQFGDRPRAGWQPKDGDRGDRGTGALLPGVWASAVVRREASNLAGGPDRQFAETPAETPAGKRRRLGLRRDRRAASGPASEKRAAFGLRRRKRAAAGLHGGKLALAAGGLALACTAAGGVIGGYIALHAQTDPSYSLGTVPPALMNRPAGSIAGIAARVTPSVVMIKVDGAQGTGSGFIIRGGYIVTDNHVVTLDGEVTNATLEVYFSNGKTASGQLVGRDPFSDIAVIKTAGLSGPALTLGNSTAIDVGDPVIAVGSPLGLAGTVTSGIVSAIDRPVQPGAGTPTSPQVYFDAIQTDAPINPGNSGGPLVNARGQVIGVDAAIDTLGDNPLTGTQGGSIGLGFAIPINQVRRVATELIRTGHATHAVLGAELNAGWGGTGAQIERSRHGAPATVTAGGPAAAAGLLPGDVIVKFDGQLVTNAATLLDGIRSLAPGATVSVTFDRHGQIRVVSLKLGSAPS
jgi:S1-C subfamily serine protease